MEAYQKKNEERDPPKSKFDPHKKISMSLDAPAPAKDYDVTYDPKIGNKDVWINSIFFLKSPRT